MLTSNLKSRHYSALSSKLKNLQQNLLESEKQLELMSDQLLSMEKLGISCGSQFMSVSRLLDIELIKVTQSQDSQQQQQQQQQQRTESTESHNDNHAQQ